MSECWFNDLETHEASVYSQSGEDGTLAHLFDRIGTTNRFFVEFGAKDGQSISNTANLRLHHGWQGLLMDGDPAESAEGAESVEAAESAEGIEFAAPNLHADETAARVRKEIITGENINELLARYHVPKSFDLLSIDIDGNDYWVWKALEGYLPRVVLIEYNIFFQMREVGFQIEVFALVEIERIKRHGV